MKAFEFSGMGNYSESHNWDDGISVSLGQEFQLDFVCKHGVNEEFFNEYGGSRNVRGFVVAASEEEAEQLLKEYESTFWVKEYEAPTERPLRF